MPIISNRLSIKLIKLKREGKRGDIDKQKDVFMRKIAIINRS